MTKYDEKISKLETLISKIETRKEKLTEQLENNREKLSDLLEKRQCVKKATFDYLLHKQWSMNAIKTGVLNDIIESYKSALTKYLSRHHSEAEVTRIIDNEVEDLLKFLAYKVSGITGDLTSVECTITKNGFGGVFTGGKGSARVDAIFDFAGGRNIQKLPCRMLVHAL